eukprot:m.341676 g.341676  ORF g.341676 m.341676 type:complete len:467 (+) comp20340_c0_seq1:83-1483(+)
MKEPAQSELRQRKHDSQSNTNAKVENKKPPSKQGCACRCLKTSCRLLFWLVGLVSLVILGCYTIYYNETQLFLMRFFRDLSRSKAHARLHGNNNALMMMLAGKEEILPLKESNEDGYRMTLEELAKFNGEDDSPLYLAILGRIYDVSAGKSFYGPGRSYHHYIAKDATRSFATGCAKPECLVPSVVGLSETQKREAYRWLELYEYHDKYKYIGRVEENPVADLVEQAMLEEEALNAAREAEADLTNEDGSTSSFDTIIGKAKEFFRDRKFDDAWSYFKTGLILLGEASKDDQVEVVLRRADVLVSMASLSQKRNDYNQARESYQEALDSLVVALGDENANRHPIFARALSDKAATFLLNGDQTTAVKGFKEALRVYNNAVEAGPEEIEKYGNGQESLERTTLERGNTKFNLAVTLLNNLEENEEVPSDIKQLLREIIEEFDNALDVRAANLFTKAKGLLDSFEIRE